MLQWWNIYRYERWLACEPKQQCEFFKILNKWPRWLKLKVHNYPCVKKYQTRNTKQNTWNTKTSCLCVFPQNQKILLPETTNMFVLLSKLHETTVWVCSVLQNNDFSFRPMYTDILLRASHFVNILFHGSLLLMSVCVRLYIEMFIHR